MPTCEHARMPTCPGETPPSFLLLHTLSFTHPLLHTCPGETPFDETTASFYAGSVALALEHLHNHDIIYRNVTVDAMVRAQH